VDHLSAVRAQPTTRKPLRKPKEKSGKSCATATVADKRSALSDPRTRTYSTPNVRIMSAENSLEQLKKHTKVVADTGDFDQIAKFKPQDSTTNPSLILAASTLAQYQGLVEDAVKFGKAFMADGEAVALEKAMDKLAVNFGLEILKVKSCLSAWCGCVTRFHRVELF
jgi:predicted DsbA family dithiol-disulfide isomerase